jgi:putative spermidine/putrescine transport system permease protein
MLAPVVLVVWISFFAQPLILFPPKGYSLTWYQNILEQWNFINAFILSFQVALTAMAVSMVIGLLASIGLTRFKLPGRHTLQSLFLSPLVVPVIITGMAMYIFFIRIERFMGVELVPSFVVLVLAHVVITIPWTVRLITAGLIGINAELEEAAMDLGASKWRAFWLITLPIIRPSIVAAGIFAFIFSFGNLEVSLMLVGPGETTIPIEILNYVFWKVDPTIAAVATVRIVITGILMLIADRVIGLSNVF